MYSCVRVDGGRPPRRQTKKAITQVHKTATTTTTTTTTTTATSPTTTTTTTTTTTATTTTATPPPITHTTTTTTTDTQNNTNDRYVNAFTLIAARVDDHVREFSLTAASMASDFGLIAGDVVALWIQACLYAANGIGVNGSSPSSSSSSAAVTCPLKFPASNATAHNATTGGSVLW
jgi:hypothetical protein